jgi:DNA-binding response OmpR family regulator
MAWNIDFDPQTNLVDVYVGYLRRKLGESTITTIRGAGYCLQTGSQAASPDGPDTRGQISPQN